jgi:large subunit ribosomal protein L31
MKPGIHPKYNPVVFVDGEHQIVSRSTLTSAEKRVIDGIEHFVIPIDVSAYSHPFFTGKQKLVDTEGRIDRFNKKYKREPKVPVETPAAKKEAAPADKT